MQGETFLILLEYAHDCNNVYTLKFVKILQGLANQAPNLHTQI